MDKKKTSDKINDMMKENGLMARKRTISNNEAKWYANSKTTDETRIGQCTESEGDMYLGMDKVPLVLNKLINLSIYLIFPPPIPLFHTRLSYNGHTAPS